MFYVGWDSQPRIDSWIHRQTLHLNLGKLIIEVSLPQILANGPPKKRTNRQEHGPSTEGSREAQDSRPRGAWSSR